MPLGVPLSPVPEGFPGRVDFIKSAQRLQEAPHVPLPEICFCGRSNVGKSSLINGLCNRKQLARVSGTPGRTRLINFFNVQDEVVLADLPGYGYAKVPAAMQADWGKHIQAYLASRPQLVLALMLVDIRRDPEEEEQQLYSWFAQGGRQCLIVATKADKVAVSRRKQRLTAIASALEVPRRDVVAFSALTKEGKDLLWGAILAQAKRAQVSSSASSEASPEASE